MTTQPSNVTLPTVKILYWGSCQENVWTSMQKMFEFNSVKIYLKKYNLKVRLQVDKEEKSSTLVIIISNWSQFSDQAINDIAELMKKGQVIRRANAAAFIEENGISNDAGLTPFQIAVTRLKNDISEGSNIDLEEEGGDLYALITRDENQPNELKEWPFLGKATKDLLTETWESVKQYLNQED